MPDTLPFDRHSTADDVLAGLDLHGQTYLVTGASSGLGQEAARALAAHGARVAMAVRSLERGEAAMAAIRAAHPGAALELFELDMDSLASVRRCAETVLQRLARLDGVLANAGVMAIDYARTADGFERQFGVNHLAHFLLANLLVPLLAKGRSPRVVAVSSGAHRLHDVDLDDPNFERKPYDRWDAYGQSKSANALFALGFERRFGARGIHAFVVAPGIIRETHLHHHLTEEHFKPLRERQPGVRDLPRKTTPQGAATLVYALVHPALANQGGIFLEDCAPSTVNPDASLPNGVIPWVTDAAHADRVWELSERLVGERFGPRIDARTPAAPPTAGTVASGLSVNRLPSTRRLGGRELTFILDDGTGASLTFDEAGTRARWHGLPGLASRGEAVADVVDAAQGALFIDLLPVDAPVSTFNAMIDERTGHALLVTTHMREPAQRGTSRFEQAFVAARLDGIPQQGPAPSPTRDLLGRRALYRYSADTIYEHVYLNPRWYAYQCIKGLRKGDAGSDPTSYWKLGEDLYVVTWREILIDIAAVFLYDMRAMRTTGKAWGLPGQATEVRNIPAGAFIEALSTTGYPDDAPIP